MNLSLFVLWSVFAVPSAPDAGTLPTPAPLAAIERAESQLAQARTRSQKAQAWLRLEDAVDDWAKRISSAKILAQPSAGPSYVQSFDAQHRKVTLSYCPLSQSFRSNGEGFREYLKLEPRGPRAAEAAWFIEGQFWPCGKTAPAAKDVRAGLVRTREFLKKYPTGPFAQQAHQQAARMESVLPKAAVQ